MNGPDDTEDHRDYDIPCVMHEPMEFDMAADLNPGSVPPLPVNAEPTTSQEPSGRDYQADSGGK